MNSPFKVPTGPSGIGIMFGGGTIASSISSNVDRYNMATDVVTSGAVMAGSPPFEVSGKPAGLCDGTNAYTTGGRTTGNVTTTSTHKYDIGGDTSSALGVSISTGKTYLAGCGNTTIGVISGGTTNFNRNPVVDQSTIERFTYSSETWATAAVSLALAKFDHSGFGSTTDGYFVGGISDPPSVQLTTCEKYNYTGDLISSISAMLVGKSEFAAGSNVSVGMLLGGNDFLADGSSDRRTEKHTFVGDTRAAGTLLIAGNRWKDSAGLANNITCICVGSNSATANREANSYDYNTDVVVDKGVVLSRDTAYTGYSSTTHGGI